MTDTASNHDALTFVVRLWRETNAGGNERWRGRIEHVASQEVEYVEDVDGLVRFVERWTGATSPTFAVEADWTEP